jgi:hypothetical protein
MDKRIEQLNIEISREMEDEEKMFVCQNCLGDSYLKKHVAELYSKRVCTACTETVCEAITPERIASIIRKYLPNHFSVDDGRYPGYELTLADVVKEAIKCSDPLVCEAVAEHLVNPNANEDDFYWQEQEYCVASSPFDCEEHERWYVVGIWDNIAHELTHGRRFFNDKAKNFFEFLISEALNAKSAENPEKLAVIKTLPTGSCFYRARIINGAEEAKAFKEKPADALGAPPKELAANNRMSPAGIPLLYVSDEAETCIAEVRPSIGDSVLVGRFFSTAPLKLFDFTALSSQLNHSPLSLFDPIYQQRVEHRRLLGYLHDEIARPVRANDTDYVVTQALAEFIRYDEKQAFDGIAFRSVQRNGGVNFVLFDKSTPESRVAPDWRPRFDLEISSDAATIHSIGAVHYEWSTEEGQSCKEDSPLDKPPHDARL